MKAKIDNKIVEVKVINPKYNNDSVEVELLEGSFKGFNAVVLKKDLIKEVKEKKQKRYCIQVEDFNYTTRRWYWKVERYCETEEEAFKIANKLFNIKRRILDRVEKRYIWKEVFIFTIKELNGEQDEIQTDK